MPATKDEIVSAFREAGIGKRDSFGVPYEEYFISDYDDYTNLDLVNVCGEYTDIEALNLLAQAIEDLEDDEYEKLCAYCFENSPANISELYSYVSKISDAEIYIYDGVNDETELGYYLVDNIYGGVDGAKFLADFIDFEALGRNESINFNGYEFYDDEQIQKYINDGLIEDGDDLNAGFFWCGNLGADDYDIGEAIVDELGFDGILNVEQYFDYEAFGKNYDDVNSLSWQDGFVAEIIDDIEPDDSLENDLDELYKSGSNVCPSVEKMTKMFDREKGSKGQEVAKEAKAEAKDLANNHVVKNKRNTSPER